MKIYTNRDPILFIDENNIFVTLTPPDSHTKSGWIITDDEQDMEDILDRWDEKLRSIPQYDSAESYRNYIFDTHYYRRIEDEDKHILIRFRLFHKRDVEAGCPDKRSIFLHLYNATDYPLGVEFGKMFYDGEI